MVHAELAVLDVAQTRYVSRGGLKLEGALRTTAWDLTGWRCLDVGQSTGGFTDCLLQHGAAQVVGLDVGHGQLHPSLQQDPRVVCIEGLNARSVEPLDPRIPKAAQGFDLLVGDVSFISLTLVLPALVPMLKADGRLLMLVKPQFELQPQHIGKGGIVRDDALYPVVEQRLRQCCDELGLRVQAWLDSPITGGDGNREFFIQAVRPQGA
ncbi:MAG: rRNA (cytidine-2-O)-methyltransferase TlyA [Pseudomonadota bacterium]